MKKYILIAGVNGAGKSTLYQTLHSLHSMERINTDEILKEFGDWRNPKDQIQAGKLAVLKLRKCFDEGLSFNQETTLCGKSILGNIEKAKENTVLNSIMWGLILRKQQKNELHFGCGKADMV